MFRRCVKCDRLGHTCGGPDFYLLTAEELTQRCKQRKDYLHLTNAHIAEAANMARGTVDNFFASTHSDFRYETIRPILKVLIGDECENEPCHLTSDSDQQKIQAALAENEHLRSTLDHEQQHIDFIKAQLAQEHDRSVARKRLVYILAISLAVVLSAIIIALAMDELDPTYGYFRH